MTNARAGDPGAFGHFQQLATRVEEADQLLLLASLAKKVFGREVAQLPPVRMALMGACTFHPWKELLEVRLLGEGVQPLFF